MSFVRTQKRTNTRRSERKKDTKKNRMNPLKVLSREWAVEGAEGGEERAKKRSVQEGNEVGRRRGDLTTETSQISRILVKARNLGWDEDRGWARVSCSGF